MNRLVWVQNRRSLARLFSFAYPTNITTLNMREHDFQDHHLIFAENLTANPASMLPQGESSTVYAHNCSGIISAAANARAGYSVPVANVNAALNMEYSGRERNEIALVEGRFKSPYATLLDDRTSLEPDRLNALMLLWRWYVNNPTQATANPMMLSSLEGVALYEFTQRTRDASAGMQLGGGVTTPFASVEGNIKANFTQNTTSETDTWSTAVYLRNPPTNNRPMMDWVPLPLPGQIIQDVSTFRATELPGRRTVITSSATPSRATMTPVTHVQRISGIPVRMCERGLWTVAQTASTNGTLEVTQAEPKIIRAASVERGTSAMSACELSIAYRPSATAFASPQVELNFNLRFARPVNTQFLEIPANPVVYATSNSPELAVGDSRRVYDTSTESTGLTRLRWEIVVDVRDPEGTIDWAQEASAENVQINCGAGRSAIPVRQSSVLLNRAERQARITLNYTVDTRHNLNLAMAQAELCTLTGSVTFRNSTAVTGPINIIRALPPGLEILFPSINSPQPSAPEPPAPSPAPPTPPAELDQLSAASPTMAPATYNLMARVFQRAAISTP